MRFSQVDVFCPDELDSGAGAFRGNPVAVVHDAEGLSSDQMARFADWTNLSETTFVLPPEDPRADYRLRILTPSVELPFAGHPTLGSCRAWLEAGGQPADPTRIVQECGVGLVVLRYDDQGRLAFAAPPFLREGDVEEATLDRVTDALGLEREEVVLSRWIDNGPGWLGLVLRDAATVLRVRPRAEALAGLDVGLLGPHPPGGPADVEVRGFACESGVTEDPVTGSLNAGFGVWLTRTGVLPPSYTARQGTVLGRDGRVHVTAEGDDVWVAGATSVRVSGTVHF